MAYVSKEQSKKVKAELKAAFPEIKFSVTVQHFSKLTVAIMEAPYEFIKGDHGTIYQYQIGKYPHGNILEKVFKIANQGNYNRSDAMTDYFDVGFYLDIEIGKWDKPFKLTI